MRVGGVLTVSHELWEVAPTQIVSAYPLKEYIALDIEGLISLSA